MQWTAQDDTVWIRRAIARLDYAPWSELTPLEKGSVLREAAILKSEAQRTGAENDAP